jgi:hypothetical protein
MHPLLTMLLDAADGRFPPVDGGITVTTPYAPGMAAVVAFTGHAVISADVTSDEARARQADGYGGAMLPHVLQWIAGSPGTVGVIDATLVARGKGGPPLVPETADHDDHPRVRHARLVRRNVRVFADDRGLVTLANGLAGRLELSIEGFDHGKGAGRTLITDALHAVPEGVAVFAGVAPGNARSLRAFLAAGFTPIASEVLILPGRNLPGYR